MNQSNLFNPDGDQGAGTFGDFAEGTVVVDSTDERDEMERDLYLAHMSDRRLEKGHVEEVETPLTGQEPQSLESVLETLKTNHLPQSRYMLDFGPFEGVESKLVDGLAGFDRKNPEIRQYFSDLMRESLHEAYTVCPSAIEGGEVGLKLRIEVLDDAQRRFKARYNEAYPLLDAVGVKGYQEYDNLLHQELSAERRRLQYALDHMPPPGLGRLILSGLSSVASALASRGNGHTGDQRDWRNEHIAKQMDRLDELADEIKQKAGNKEWEDDRGGEVMDRAAAAFSDIQNTMDGAEAQGDHRAFRNRLDNIRKTLEDAAAKSLSDRLKESIQGLCTSMREFVNKIKAAIGLRTDNQAPDGPAAQGGGTAPEAASPARPRPGV